MDRYTQRRLTGRPTRNRDGWRDELTDIDPAARLMMAVIRRAVADTGSTPGLAEHARYYIDSDGFAADCAWIGIDPDYIRRQMGSAKGE